MNNIDYSILDELIVKSQEELDMIPDDFAGKIYIEFGTAQNKAVVSKRYRKRVILRGNSSAVLCENSSAVLEGNSSAVLRGNSSAVLLGNSSAELRENSSAILWGNSSARLWGNSSAVLEGNSSAVLWGNSSAELCGNSSAELSEKSSAILRENSSAILQGNSSAILLGNSSAELRENSSAILWENSSAELRENSSAILWENSSAELWGNSSAEAHGNSQVVDRLKGGRIEITGNARIVYMPKTIEEYCSFYDIKHDGKKGKFFKCVHKQEGRYFSERKSGFEYKIGKKAVADYLDENPKEDCGHGIHISYLAWALNYGKNWGDWAILEVEADLDRIVLPDGCLGKVRCAEVTVLREVPLEECGVCGKILTKRLRKGENNE